MCVHVADSGEDYCYSSPVYLSLSMFSIRYSHLPEQCTLFKSNPQNVGEISSITSLAVDVPLFSGLSSIGHGQ